MLSNHYRFRNPRWRQQKHYALSDNRRPRPDRRLELISKTRAVFTDVEGLKRAQILVIGDSIIKKVDRIANTQVVGFRGLHINELNGLLHANQIPFLSSKVLIVTHIGTNNIKNEPLDLLMKKTEIMVNILHTKAPCAVIALSLTIPRLCDFNQTNSKVMKFNDAIESKRDAWTIKTMPTYRSMQFDRTPVLHFYDPLDQLHPNEFGVEAIRLFLSRKISRIRDTLHIKKSKLIRPPTIVFGKKKR